MNATNTYAKRREEIATVLELLAVELKAHDENAKRDPDNWGYVGNLGKIREDLVNALGFLQNLETEQVEQLLASR